MATWRANAVIGLMWPGVSGQIKPIFIDDYPYNIEAGVGSAVCLNGRNRCREWGYAVLNAGHIKQQIRSRYPFKQASRRFGHEGYRLTNSMVDCLLTTQARQEAQPRKGNSSA